MLPEFLVGWKNIAGALGIPSATLRRWRDIHGFPVSKIPGGDVIVSRTQAIEWLDTRRQCLHELGMERIKGRQAFRKAMMELYAARDADYPMPDRRAPGLQRIQVPGHKRGQAARPPQSPNTSVDTDGKAAQDHVSNGALDHVSDARTPEPQASESPEPQASESPEPQASESPEPQAQSPTATRPPGRYGPIK